MTKVIKFPIQAPAKIGHRKVRKRRKPDLEEFGQLNLFDQHKIIPLGEKSSLFEQAIQLDGKNNEQAALLYKKAIETNDNTQDAYCNLAILKSAEGHLVEAADLLTHCLKENPRHLEAHYNLGNVYSELGNFALARVHYELAIEIDPNYSNSFYNLGLVLISLKEYKKAIHVINQYIELGPEGDVNTAQELLTTLNAIAQ